MIATPGSPARRGLLARARAAAALSLALLALASSGAAAQARIEIRLWHAMQGARGEAVEALADAFNRSQQGFELKPQYKGEYPELLLEAVRASRENTPPHIVQVYDIGTQDMLLSGSAVPIQRLMRQQDLNVDWGDFLQTISAYYAQDGKLQSMPFNVSAPILFYNKDVFAKAGLAGPPPTTWAQLEAASRQILATGAAKCGFTTAGSPSWSLLENTFAWHGQPFATNQNGYNGLDTRLLIDSPFGRMHLSALARWHRDGIFVYGGREGSGERFANGDCAMVLAESGQIGNFKRTLGFQWGTGQLPHWGPPYPKENTLLGGATLWALRGHSPAQYKGIAQFMKFLAEPQQQAWWASHTGFVPVGRKALALLNERGFYAQQPEQRTALSQLLNTTPSVNSQGIRLGNFPQIREVIEGELVDIVEGKKSVEEGLDAVALKGNALLRAFRVINGAASQGEI